ncbi:NifU family protein [Mycolicibacterium lutetiense]|uniref:Fe-S cluster biogenesis protein NfuA/nitrite reductase/ring-hydroxylating ferredoxin subunit n=1 Tax=Mycolicibacterium lutetiense TaxID=1641992 RepID=A0ABS4ZUZ7_9MYCO|nr:NifU family protein [Mycolicibacterium lutetiense]MBP2452963.1 Fe-S cluster biogenesis protein NfuA/nitrite reductase/ring-hydroxylating ferredoxin subunit [Mycolicibacterium lutetiense]
MPPAQTPVPDHPEDDTRWRTAGDRIEALLDASAAGGPGALQNAEQLIRELTDLYGAALARLLRIATNHSAELAEVAAADSLVASLLLVHGLHPHPVHRRIADALDKVRPYLGSHGGDVDLIEVDGPVVRLRFTGSCRGCPSSAATLELTIEDAIRAAAPEITSIDVVADSPAPNLIPAQSLLARVHPEGHRPAAWQPVPAIDELTAGEVGGFAVAGSAVLACRIGAQLFVYRDRCPKCTRGLAGATLAGAVLHCPYCGSGFDVVHAGAGCGGEHLEPVPLLVRDGVYSIALAEEVAS